MPTDEYDRVRCRLCNREFKAITPTHLQKDHDLTVAEYAKRFPDAPLFNKARGVEHSERMKEVWADPSYKKRTSRSLKRSAKDPQFRERMADLATERWRDPEYKKRVSKAVSEAHSTSEARAAQSARSKRNWRENREEMTEKVRENQAIPRRRKAAKRAMKRKWAEDPAYRKKMRRVGKRQWTPEKREAKSKEMKRKWKDPEYKALMSEQSQKMWEDPEHQERMKPIVARWTKPERVVRGWLRKMSLYKTGHDGGVGFLPHRWLPTRGAGFSANGDFVDYNHKLILHVDGDYWHSRPEVVEQDQRLNAWCDANGWSYLRLTESDVYKRPVRSQRTILRFARSA